VAPARILLSTLLASTAAAHGGPVLSRRHAAALCRQNARVLVAAPVGDAERGGPFEVAIYKTRRDPGDFFAPHLPDKVAIASLRALIDRFQPDVLYDLHGPAYAIDAAKEAGLPVVSMVGDYMWYCLMSFLVDSAQKRCSGPESARKCYDCINRSYPIRWQVYHGMLKPAADAGILGFHLHDGVGAAREYRERMRALVDSFVIGDAQADEFFTSNGVPASRVHRIPQGLPASCLARRPRESDETAARRALRLGFVGRPQGEKGMQTLAAAFDSLPPELPVELWIVHAHLATPSRLRRQFPSTVRFLTALRSGRVKLFRPTSHDEVLSLMARIDLGVVPSNAYESPSLALLEFAAQGTPVVRSESRGMEHVIQDGVNGRTFPYGDAAALAAILREIAADRPVLARWRARLPPISTDDDYAGRLLAVFAAQKEPMFQHV
jgi:glycosyltransferase involved in cell wall biosynthesis